MGMFVFDSIPGRLIECTTARCALQLEGDSADVLFEGKNIQSAYVSESRLVDGATYETNTRACSCTSKAESPLSRPQDFMACSPARRSQSMISPSRLGEHIRVTYPQYGYTRSPTFLTRTAPQDEGATLHSAPMTGVPRRSERWHPPRLTADRTLSPYHLQNWPRMSSKILGRMRWR